jgi:CHAD domain-containing protein
MLTLDDRAILQQFVARSAPGDAYLRRVRILLLADDGLPAEQIAAEIGVPLAQTRNFLRAFNKQGLAVFPTDLFRPPAPFGPAEPLSSAARQIARRQLEQVDFWLPQIVAAAGAAAGAVASDAAGAVAVHELRKTIRQLRTALLLITAHDGAQQLVSYRRKLRRLMICLADSRDLTVFTANLSAFSEQDGLSSQERAAAGELLGYWQERLAEANAVMGQQVSRPRWRKLLNQVADWAAMAEQPLPAGGEAVPYQIRHLLPVLVYEQLAAVRAYDGLLPTASLAEWHGLRIQLKRLRYLLEFFEPLLAASATELINQLKEMLELLGVLNDARVGQALLVDLPADLPGAAAVPLIQTALEAQIGQYKAEFDPYWRALNQIAWRQKLAMALVVL